MSYALHGPYFDVDFPGSLPNTRDINVFISGGVGDFTVTIPLPSSGGDLTVGPVGEGAYFTSDALTPGTILDALATALNLTDPEGAAVWLVRLAAFTPGVELPMRCEIRRTGTANTYNMRWDNIATTFDPQILGFEGSSNSGPIADGVSLFSEWQVGRAWFHDIDTFEPERARSEGTSLLAGNYRGAVQGVSIGTLRKRKTFSPGPVEGARVHRWIADRADMIAAVPGLVLGDENTPLEALWEAIRLARNPIRLIEDPYGTQDARDYQNNSIDQMKAIDALISNTDEGPRFYNLAMAFNQYVRPLG